MEDSQRTRISCGRFFLLLSQGMIMGIGAVLPGISAECCASYSEYTSQ